MRRVHLTVLLVAVAGVFGSSALPPTFATQSASQIAGPSPRSCPAMAYDRARQQIVLFGGSDADNSPLYDTWTWDGAAWTEQHPPTSPSPRACSAIAYDAGRRDVVLFDGLGEEPSETWTWDGTTWTQESPRHSPQANGAVMAYDAARSVIVLFGDDYDGGRADTWTWDGADWTDVRARAPAGRDFPGIAYDGARGQVVLFGGETSCGDLGCYPLKHTFTWEGDGWQKRRPAKSPVRRATPA